MGFEYDADGASVKEDQPKGLPEGDYEFRVIDLPKHSVTSTNRNMLTMYLVVDDGEYSGRKIRFNLVFIPRGEPSHSMTVKALLAFGLESDGKVQVNESDFQDKLVRAHVKVKNEKYVPKGETDPITVPKSEIGWFLLEGDRFTPPGAQTATTVAAKKVRDEDEVPF